MVAPITQLPRLSGRRRITEIDLRNLTAYDLFISACGSDDRAYQWMSQLVFHRLIDQSILFDYKERRKRTGDGKYRKFREFLNGPTLIDYSTTDRKCEMRELIRLARANGTPQRVALDISAFTKPHFFAVLRALKVFLGVKSVDVFYTEPGNYLKSYANRRYEFSTGHFEPFDIPGFNGFRITRNKRLLLILLGFEGRASMRVWEETAPTTTVLLNGFPAYLLPYKDVSMLSNKELIDENGETEIDYAPANDPFETYNSITRICKDFSDHAITIAPLGPKPMALGAAIYALDNESVRVEYPLPRSYSNVVSKGCGESWIYPLVFS